ncbi:hypothetical protein [Sphingomonas endophytica]|uniref:hypothetical protein n=1 Tax=Sphingomonas endophytica TaxID=869719 RepID=UPI000ADA11EB|nr:hypothetical protein [Sphingomonas endophytica]
MSDTTLRAMLLLLVLILPVSALLARRVAPMMVLRYAAAWAGIAVLLYIGITAFT